ncbi:hypothetical protein PGIGA_G00260500 [Pangasianodon gigas]|uniref:Uncharacterized protein n=1 Tax=Pangasianodon gigas TaxID=30993 RepID=A0ACC5WSW7_PANGG|nr:hypothetical protein [Pangasianodon gigas]
MNPELQNPKPHQRAEVRGLMLLTASRAHPPPILHRHWFRCLVWTRVQVECSYYIQTKEKV